MATKLLYLDDFNVVAGKAKVTAVSKTDDGRTDVFLDQTCFYPRGGGQDWDLGTIGLFVIEEVRLDENGVVHHIGTGQITEGATVELTVDQQRRDINTRLHSGGHIVDMAMSSIRPDLIPQKGAHYPHMSNVEYAGSVDDTTKLQITLQEEINIIFQKQIANSLQLVSKQELQKLCRHVPANIPENKPTRVVLYGDFGVPCGGTHVKNLQDVGKIEVTKIKSKKGITKVSYRIEGIN